jgi:hypothetical protein
MLEKREINFAIHHLPHILEVDKIEDNSFHPIIKSKRYNIILFHSFSLYSIALGIGERVFHML